MHHLGDAPAGLGPIPCDTLIPTESGCARLGPDFSTTTNPNGAWQYGYETTLGGAFTVYDTFYAGNDATFNGLSVWAASNVLDHQGAHIPVVGANTTGATLNPVGTYSVAPGQTIFHPGERGQYSVARYTPPSAGVYVVQVTFSGESGSGGAPVTTTDGHLQLNSGELNAGSVTPDDPTQCFAQALQLATTDVIDAAVGNGGGDYNYDSTGVELTICAQ